MGSSLGFACRDEESMYGESTYGDDLGDDGERTVDRSSVINYDIDLDGSRGPLATGGGLGSVAKQWKLDQASGDMSGNSRSTSRRDNASIPAIKEVQNKEKIVSLTRSVPPRRRLQQHRGCNNHKCGRIREPTPGTAWCHKSRRRITMLGPFRASHTIRHHWLRPIDTSATAQRRHRRRSRTMEEVRAMVTVHLRRVSMYTHQALRAQKPLMSAVQPMHDTQDSHDRVNSVTLPCQHLPQHTLRQCRPTHPSKQLSVTSSAHQWHLLICWPILAARRPAPSDHKDLVHQVILLAVHRHRHPRQDLEPPHQVAKLATRS